MSVGRAASGIIVGALVLLGVIFFVIPLIGMKPNVGSIFGSAATVVLALLWLLFPLAKAHTPLKICYIIFLTFIAVGVAYAAFLTANMIMSAAKAPEIVVNVSDGAETAPPLIIFGGKVNADKPSGVLEGRLETGLDYLEKYPNAICIVSGGQGADESCTEASVMKAWLVERGIDESRIYTEDKSTSTWENLKYSTQILGELGYAEKTIAAASDGFHLYRIGLMAKTLGYEAESVPSHSVSYLLPMYTVREWFALSAWFAGGWYE